MLNKEQLLFKMNSLPFKDEIISLGGNIFCVGGILRDIFLNKESKDFDIMVTGVMFNDLINLLHKHGKVDTVGQSFGIIKFKAFGEDDDIDISLPRKEISTGERGHKSFEVMTDPFLPIEEDLIRRDLTINSMAMTMDGIIIDPFNGLIDIEEMVIKMTNRDTFFEDPLRMLRAVVFASRFNFNIDKPTLDLIIKNKHRINEISPERILIELEKLVIKGDPLLGLSHLIDSGLFTEIFGIPSNKVISDSFKKVRTIGEFIFLCVLNTIDNKIPSKFWLEDLKGDLKTFKEIQALEQLNIFILNKEEMLKVMFSAFKISPDVIKTELWDNELFKECINDFNMGVFPKSLKEVQINGTDLLVLGLKGPDIGITLDKCVTAIFGGQIKNENKYLTKFVFNEII